MKVSVSFLSSITCLLWASPSNAFSTQHASTQSATQSTTTSLNAFSRRDFVATSISGAVLASTLPRDVALAAPTGLSLVEDNSLSGKVVVITGASTGIGLESAKALAKGGATVVLTARTNAKGAKAVETVQDYLTQTAGVQNNNVFYVQLDLDDLDNVKSFPERFQAKLKDTKIDVLMNNAGVMAIPDRQLTKDGYERTFQSNHLGHFALTAKLAPLLNSSSRVINVSSSAYQFASKGLELDNLNGEKEYSPWGSYGLSKLENILFTNELQRRATAQGMDLTAISLHPGAINTDLARNMMGGEESWYEKKAKGPSNIFEQVVQSALNKAFLTPEEGAATQVYLATSGWTENSAKSPERGGFYSELKSQKLPAFATDPLKARALWEKSEELSGVKFSLGP